MVPPGCLPFPAQHDQGQEYDPMEAYAGNPDDSDGDCSVNRVLHHPI